MISHYLSFAYRNLLRNKIHTAINIVGLGIGLVCFVGAYLFVDYAMFVDRVPLTPVPFLMSFLATLAIATAAVASQVLLTARVNPARVLRVE
jgi:ABC-type antimicrobial peptide transport system permease subunit